MSQTDGKWHHLKNKRCCVRDGKVPSLLHLRSNGRHVEHERLTMAGNGNKHEAKVPKNCLQLHENNMKRCTNVLSFNATANQRDLESISKGKYHRDDSVLGRVNCESLCF